MNTQNYSFSSEEETLKFAHFLAGQLKPGDVVLLFGELGAGKTFLTRGIVSYFDPGMAISSPTFTLVNVYPTKPPIYHFDLYRIQTEEDLLDLGLQEYIDSDGIVVVEWGEKCENTLRKKYYRIDLKITGESGREVTLQVREYAGSRH